MTSEKPALKKTAYIDTKVVFSVFALIIALRLSLPFMLPFGQTDSDHLEGLNDEPAHYNYVKYIAVNRAFPVLTHWVLEPDAFTRNEFEYHQAPLYYLLCVPLYLLFGEQGAVIPCRLLSAIFGILSVLFVFLIVRDLGYGKRTRLAALLFSGMLFSHVYFSSVVSNDALSWLLALVVTRELLRLITNDDPAPQKIIPLSTAILTLACAAGLLTKSSFLIFLPVILGVFVYQYRRLKNAVIIIRAALVCGVSALLALPWYIRNIQCYHSLSGMPQPDSTAPFSLTSITAFSKGLVKYFWFPQQNLDGGTTGFAVLMLCGGILIAVNLALSLYYILKNRERYAATMILAGLLLIYAGAAFWYYLQWQNPEARFLFPAIGSIVFFMTVPAERVFERLKKEHLFLPYIMLLGLLPYLLLFFTK